MKDLAPHIYRQRLVIEGFFSIKITPARLKTYVKKLSIELGMTILYGPIVKKLAEKLNSIYKGFECVLIWAESGVSLYTWENEKFFTVDIYTCKKFKVETAVKFTKEFFATKKIEFKSV